MAETFTTNQSRSNRDRPGLLKLFFVMGAGPGVWAVFLIISYAIVEAGCRSFAWQSEVLGISMMGLVIVILTLIALAVVLYAAFLGYTTWKNMGAVGAGEVDSDDEWLDNNGERFTSNRGRFMAFAGMLLASIFSLVILISGIPLLVLRPCTW